MDCKNGRLYIDYDAYDKFILLCTACKLRVKNLFFCLKFKIKKYFLFFKLSESLFQFIF